MPLDFPDGASVLYHLDRVTGVLGAVLAPVLSQPPPIKRLACCAGFLLPCLCLRSQTTCTGVVGRLDKGSDWTGIGWRRAGVGGGGWEEQSACKLDWRTPKPGQPHLGRSVAYAHPAVSLWGTLAQRESSTSQSSGTAPAWAWALEPAGAGWEVGPVWILRPRKAKWGILQSQVEV